jgi:hypothetical protein
VRAAVDRRDRGELGRADDVDPAVGAILDSEYLVAADQAVLDDPVEASAHQLVGTARSHSGCDPKLSASRTRRDPGRERLDVAATECDLRQMESRHGF